MCCHSNRKLARMEHQREKNEVGEEKEKYMITNGYSYFFMGVLKYKIHFVSRQKLIYISCTINIIAMFIVHGVYLILLHLFVCMWGG